MAGIIGIIIMLTPITSPAPYNMESDGIPFAGWMSEVVVTAPRYYRGGSDSAPFFGWMPEVAVASTRDSDSIPIIQMPEILVTAKRYNVEEDLKIVRGNLSTSEDSNKSIVEIQSGEQEM